MLLASGTSIDPGTITLIVALVGCVIGVAGFFRNGNNDHEDAGAKWATIENNIHHIRADLTEIKNDVKDSNHTHSRAVENLRKELNESIKRVNDKVDNHIIKDHVNKSYEKETS